MALDDLYLALGTNMGCRESNIRMALKLLDIALGRHYCAISPVMQTEATGFTGPDFLNCIVKYRSGRSPQSLLKICKDIEKRMGRTDVPEYDTVGNRIYHDRIIDIDILMYGNRRIETAELTIPHPQVETRPYIKELLLNLRDL